MCHFQHIMCRQLSQCKDLYHRCRTAPISIYWKTLEIIWAYKPTTTHFPTSMIQVYRTTLPVQLNKDVATSDLAPQASCTQASRCDIVYAYKTTTTTTKTSPSTRPTCCRPDHHFRYSNIRLLGSPWDTAVRTQYVLPVTSPVSLLTQTSFHHTFCTVHTVHTVCSPSLL